MTTNYDQVCRRNSGIGRGQQQTATSGARPANVPVTFWSLSFTPQVQHRAVLAVGQPVPIQVSLQNTDGFWELTLGNETAAVPQHFGLFYVAWLLAHPGEAPMSGVEIESGVCAQFAEHEDFPQPPPTIWLKTERAQALRALRPREQALNRIVDSPDQLDPVRNEALAELVKVQGLEAEQLNEFLDSARGAGVSIRKLLVNLHNSLAVAVDPRGNPHPVLRGFARHLLLRIIIPSARATRALAGEEHFTYQPDPNTN
jgi:hypothetical protein